MLLSVHLKAKYTYSILLSREKDELLVCQANRIGLLRNVSPSKPVQANVHFSVTCFFTFVIEILLVSNKDHLILSLLNRSAKRSNVIYGTTDKIIMSFCLKKA